MKLLRKQLLLVSIVLVLVVSMTGCIGGGKNAQVTPPPGALIGTETVSITGAVTATLDSGKVIVSSDANIMDGALVELSVTSVASKTLASKVIVKNGDNLKAEFIIGDEWGSDVYAFVVMTKDSSGKQADHIYLAYGENFENIEADTLLYNSKSYMFVLQSEKLAIK